MTSKIKQAVIQMISESLSKENYFGRPKWIGPLLKQSSSTYAEDNTVHYEIKLPKCLTEGLENDFRELVSNKDKINEAGASYNIHFKEIDTDTNTLKLEICIKDFIKKVLTSNPVDLGHIPEGEKVVVEFSSPNIAKEFHVGHLRSTVIGNVLSNVFTKMGKDVVRMNYLGDWGTQMGFLKVGVDILGYTEESLKDDTVQKLQTAYVHANNLAIKDVKVREMAQEIFKKLEFGDEEESKMWANFREWSKKDLVKMYDRLNVKFDEYSWESLYGRNRSLQFLENLEKRFDIIVEDENGRKVADVDGNKIPLMKSDGATLYILRDLLAVLDRKNKYNFDKHYYVVGDEQSVHFKHLFQICEKIEPHSSEKLVHVPFRKVRGMCTRRGTSASLRDFLDEATERMYSKQVATASTRGGANMATAEILGASALIINDLMHRRTSSYDFRWEDVLKDHSTNSGVRLQYVHCRLCSLQKNSGVTSAGECDPEALLEQEAILLVKQIAKFEEVLAHAEESLEPHLIVHYMVQLCKAINSALRSLPVKNAEAHVGSQRLLLFNASRLVLAEGLRLLGIRCLEEM